MVHISLNILKTIKNDRKVVCLNPGLVDYGTQTGVAAENGLHEVGGSAQP